MIEVSDITHLKIVIINAHPEMRALIRSQLYIFSEAEFYEAPDGAKGMEIIRNIQPQLVISALSLPSGDGISFTSTLRNAADSPHPYVPIILIMPASAQNRISEARDAGVNAIVLSPFSVQSLQDHVREIILHPRPFIRTSTYFGPDRRMFSRPANGSEPVRLARS